MKKPEIFRTLSVALTFVVLSIGLLGCSDEPSSPSSSDNKGNIENSESKDGKEIRPDIKLIANASTTDEIIVSFRVKSVSKPTVRFSWSAESGKTSSPKYNNSSNVSRTYDEVKLHSGNATEYYYKVTHAGFRPGNYVYYKIEASNTKGDDSAKGYVIIKR